MLQSKREVSHAPAALEWSSVDHHALSDILEPFQPRQHTLEGLLISVEAEFTASKRSSERRRCFAGSGRGSLFAHPSAEN